MHDGPHYKLRRLSSSHPFESSGEPVAEPVEVRGKKPIRGALVCNVFMRPPDDGPTIKYGSVVREILEMVDLLHMSLISMQNTHPLLEVLELANNCRQVVTRLSDLMTDPILFAGSFAEYYLNFLKDFQLGRGCAVDNIRYALGGGIPSIIRACEGERSRIAEAKKVYGGAVKELSALVQDRDDAEGQMEMTYPFTLKTVQTLQQIISRFNQMEIFCRHYEEYFGQDQYRHLHELLQGFEYGTVTLPSRQENAVMIGLWTRYDRFTLHFPTEIDNVMQFFQASANRYRVRSTENLPLTSSPSSIYSSTSSLLDHTSRRGTVHGWEIPMNGFKILDGKPGEIRRLIRDKTFQWYCHLRILLNPKRFVD
ncbi:hypothetical protein P691DRAFT_676280 [Macrolepiota fuliginosa MF-IS2]|uniref:Uncharacterized protein n=1 Tax=Macrolepiota fuliginosa MF-IS2 TaxID=1400762 RepID=A0A9P5X989_9AGAR|nr:hypothetical protein P691DRAFT_676280 [Macrolepiota fuliginosa MF-IS2]